MTNYIRKCSLELLSYYYSNTELEEEFSSLLRLLQEPESIQIVVNLSKDKELIEVLNLIDDLVESKLVYNEENKSDTIFKELITDELATTFLYRLVKLS